MKDNSTLYETGNKKFFIVEIDNEGQYGDKIYHESLMEVKLDFAQEIAEIGADDNPSYISFAGPLTCDGTVKFASLPLDMYSKFFGVDIDSNNVTYITSDNKPKHVAFGFYSSVGNGSETMFTLYKATFALPSINSVSFDGKTIRDLTLKVKAQPKAFKIDNKHQNVSYSILNSEINADIWDNVQEHIYIPNMEIIK